MNSTSNLLAVVSVCVLGIFVYSNTFHSPFHFDGERCIAENVSIRNLTHLRAIWDYWPTRFTTFLSLAFNYHFNGLRVFGYHVVNLVVHLTSAIVVRWFIILTFCTPAMKNKEITRHAKSIAFFAGLLFVAHPIQTQAVTYVIQRATSMATLLYLTSLSLYIKARLSQNQRLAPAIYGFYYGSSMVAALLGMLTKELFVTLPLMMLLYEFCFLGVKKNVNWRYIVPFLIILLLIILVMMIDSESGISGAMRRLAEAAGGMSRGHYFSTQFRVLVTYLRLLFVPLNQNLDYDYPIWKSLWEIPTLASGAALLLILAAGILLFPRYRLISFCIFWFFLTLSVESSVIPLADVIFEHRLYLPMVGYSIFLPTIIYYICRKKLKLRIVKVILLIIITFYSVLAYTRNEVWKSQFALWDDTVTKSPGKARPYANRASAYFNLGLYGEAISDCNRALSINPNREIAYNNRGLAYLEIGEFDKAISDFNQVLRIDPNHEDAYNNRGTGYFRKGEFDRAISDFSQVLRIDPNHEKAYDNRGTGYFRKGEFDKAISDFNQAVRINPNYASPYHNRGIAYERIGEYDKAMFDFNQVLRIDPNHEKAYNNRGVVYLRRGELDKAISDFNKALSINPDYTSAYNNRRAAYEEMGRE